MALLRTACIDIRKDIINSKSGLTLPDKPNATRWGSTYNMLDGILFVREKYRGYLTDRLWILAQEMAEALHPVHELTVRMLKEQYVFGDFLKDIMECEEQLLMDHSAFGDKLQETFAVRKMQILNDDNLSCLSALYLDPRYNFSLSKFFKAEQKIKIINYLSDLHKKIQMIKNRDSTLQSPPPAPATTTPKTPNPGPSSQRKPQFTSEAVREKIFRKRFGGVSSDPRQVRRVLEYPLQ